MQDLAAVLAAEYPQGLDIVYEGVGGSVRAAIMPHLAPGGRLLQVGYISGAHTKFVTKHQDNALHNSTSSWQGAVLSRYC